MIANRRPTTTAFVASKTYKLNNANPVTLSGWSYNTKGQLKSIPGYIALQTYALDGITDVIAYANGVSTNFGYSPTRRWLNSHETRKSDGTILLSGSYGRDVVGKILTVDEAGTDKYWTYTYNGFDRLVSATNAGNAPHSDLG